MASYTMSPLKDGTSSIKQSGILVSGGVVVVTSVKFTSITYVAKVWLLKELRNQLTKGKPALRFIGKFWIT